jgi:hypothetical protein
MVMMAFNVPGYYLFGAIIITINPEGLSKVLSLL